MTVDEGMNRLNKIMDGKTFPKWIVVTTGARFEPDWGSESMDLCNKVIGNTLEELAISWKVMKVGRPKRSRREVLPRDKVSG